MILWSGSQSFLLASFNSCRSCINVPFFFRTDRTEDVQGLSYFSIVPYFMSSNMSFMSACLAIGSLVGLTDRTGVVSVNPMINSVRAPAITAFVVKTYFNSVINSYNFWHFLIFKFCLTLDSNRGDKVGDAGSTLLTPYLTRFQSPGQSPREASACIASELAGVPLPQGFRRQTSFVLGRCVGCRRLSPAGRWANERTFRGLWSCCGHPWPQTGRGMSPRA
jgi:hypothetical protein